MTRLLCKAALLSCLLFFGGLLILFPATGSVWAADEAEEQYTCGMHPMIVVDEPGICPICQMDLTPLKAGTGSGRENRQVIEIDPITSQKMGIRTALVERRNLVRSIHTVGLVAYEEPTQHAINSKVSGWVEKLFINKTGQSVSKGEALLEIYSPDLVTAQEELLLALDNSRAMNESGFPEAAQGAEQLLEAARKRLELWDISPGQVKVLEKSRKVLKSLTLNAPAAGIVSRKQVREGEYVKVGAELLEISDISKLWVYADIYEYETPWVAEGQRAEISFPFSIEPIVGRIDTIYPFLEARTRTIKARIDIDNPGYQLKPDMYADVQIFVEPEEQILCIPAEAVLYTGKKETVFVVLDEGRFEPRQIRVGLQDDEGFVAVLSGLREGEAVVTSAQFMLDSESKLREALEKMRAPVPQAAGDDLDDLFAEEKSE